MESKRLPAPIVIPTELKELSCQIEQWRGTRPHRMAMPEPLWILAANLAKQHGLSRVARLLRLDYYSLKEWIESLKQDSRATSVAKPTFIELPPPLPVTPISECTIELEHPRGRRMRIHVKGAAMPDLAALSRTLWGMKS
jgi:hypothetical protein